MSNAGIFAGLNPGGWKNYVPELRGLSFLGSGITQPLLLDPRNTLGRYMISNQGLVRAQAQITFATGDTIGSGDSYYVVSLPVPGSRSSGGADLPIGQMFMYQGAVANPILNMIGQTTLADAGAPGAQFGREDYYAQAFIQNLIAYGTATFGSAATTATVTHGMSETPNAYDIHLTLTNTPSTNPQWISVQNIGATTFDIVLKASATTTPATVAWKVEMFPTSGGTSGVRMSSTAPWNWAAGHSIGMNVQYEARR